MRPYAGANVLKTPLCPQAFGFVNVKLFCSACKGRETFTATWMRDVDRETENTGRFRTTPARIHKAGAPTQQHFCAAYFCMRAVLKWVIVIVARRGWHLSLEGRSPLEIVGASSFIPKKERSLFPEALMAKNVGRSLATIFFLRTLIEQFAKRQTGLKDAIVTGDRMMDAYAKTRPLEYREVMPSLKGWYTKLSVAIHCAKSDEDLLSEAMTEIEKHFKLRDAFSISDATQKSD